MPSEGNSVTAARLQDLLYLSISGPHTLEEENICKTSIHRQKILPKTITIRDRISVVGKK